MIQLGSAYGEIRIGTGEAEQSIQSLSQKLSSVGRTMSLAISAPLLAIGGAGLKAAAGFEQSMNQVAVISSATASEMAQMSAKALQLGKDTSFSAGEAADGFLELSKAGFSAQQSTNAIGGVLDLAAAGGLSVAKAAEIASNAINSFGLEASESGRIADLLAAAANASSIEVTDMAQAFQMSSSVFASNGQSIEDLSTAIAILGNNGIKGSDAGTSLKTMLMRLAAPTDVAAGAMEKLGLRVYNADGSMRSFEDITADLTDATSGLSDAQRNAAFNTIFGADAIRAANILVAEGTQEWSAMETAVTKAGAAEEVAQARMKGLSGAIDYIKGTLESLLIGAFLPFTTAIGDVIRWIADLAARFGELPQPIINAALAFGAVLAVIGPLLVALPMIGGVLAALLSPIGLIAIAVAGLAAAWVADWGGIQEKTAAVVEAIGRGIQTLIGWIQEAARGDFGPLIEGLQRAFDDAVRLGREAFTGFVAALQGALQEIGINVSDLNWADIITPLRDWAQYVGQLVWTGFVTALDWGAGFVSQLPWGDYVSTLSDWGQWITSLDWTQIITTVIDWATWIPALVWNNFVKILDWVTIVGAFVWTEWISKLEWPESLGSFDWASWISGVLDWAIYIGEFAWDSFISKLEWPLIAKFDWGTWIKELAWDTYVTAVDLAGKVGEFAWDTFITAVDLAGKVGEFLWDNYITKITWPTALGSFNWNTFVPFLLWPAVEIGGFAWDLFVQGVDLAAQVGEFLWDNYITKLTWPAISEFAWDTYVTTVDLAAKVGEFLWDTYVTAVDLAAQVGEFLWDTYVSQLTWPAAITNFNWNTFVPFLMWPAVDIGSFDWASWINPLNWSDYLSEFLGWSSYIRLLIWGAVISDVTWSDYIPKLDWGTKLGVSLSWSDYVPDLNWAQFVVTALDWATWIPAFTWNTFVAILDWTTIIVSFAWVEFIKPLVWGDAVKEIDWGQFIGEVLFWSVFIPQLTWAFFVDKLEWPIIAQVDWSEYIPDFGSWSAWVDTLVWPDVSFDWNMWVKDLTWPDISFDGWSTWIDDLDWPDVSFDWNTWVDSLVWPDVSFDWNRWVDSLDWPDVSFDWNRWVDDLTWPRIDWPGWREWIPSFPGWPDIRSIIASFVSGRLDSPEFATGGSIGRMLPPRERSPEMLDLAAPRQRFDTASRQLATEPMVHNHYYQIYNSLDEESVANRVIRKLERLPR